MVYLSNSQLQNAGISIFGEDDGRAVARMKHGFTQTRMGQGSKENSGLLKSDT